MLEATNSSAAKHIRCADANSVIHAISKHGRRFFLHNGHVSRFELDQRGRIWYIDKYSQRRIYVAYKHNWRGFSEGGTLRCLIEALRDYIRTGQKISQYHFGPWPESCCYGDLWGYGKDEMQKLRDELSGSPSIAVTYKESEQ